MLIIKFVKLIKMTIKLIKKNIKMTNDPVDPGWNT